MNQLEVRNRIRGEWGPWRLWRRTGWDTRFYDAMLTFLSADIHAPMNRVTVKWGDGSVQYRLKKCSC